MAFPAPGLMRARSGVVFVLAYFAGTWLGPGLPSGRDIGWRRSTRTAYSPAGTPSDIAEALAPYVEAGCRTFHLVPVASSLEEALYGVAEVKHCLAGAVPARVNT